MVMGEVVLFAAEVARLPNNPTAHVLDAVLEAAFVFMAAVASNDADLFADIDGLPISAPPKGHIFSLSCLFDKAL